MEWQRSSMMYMIVKQIVVVVELCKHVPLATLYSSCVQFLCRNIDNKFIKLWATKCPMCRPYYYHRQYCVLGQYCSRKNCCSRIVKNLQKNIPVKLLGIIFNLLIVLSESLPIRLFFGIAIYFFSGTVQILRNHKRGREFAKYYGEGGVMSH